ncbi:MAG: DUF1844 domain-containing protein [Syntrophobacteraceae bacterium]
MDEKEDKGFVVKDRRKISLEDSEEAPSEQMSEPGPESKERAGAAASESEPDPGPSGPQLPLPEVSFATFVFSLCSSALVHLGEVPEPESRQTMVDLTVAKQIIDTLGMLEEKTKGNLDQDEEHLLKSMLYDLRVRYVQKSTG